MFLEENYLQKEKFNHQDYKMLIVNIAQTYR
jgi:hypothetical protein